MKNSIQKNLGIVLEALYEMPKELITSGMLQEKTQLTPDEINDACNILENSGYVELLQYTGTHPFDFGDILITSAGRFEYERAMNEVKNQNKLNKTNSIEPQITRNLFLIGSPYGFLDEDWEILSSRKNDSENINIVFGFQFNSDKYTTQLLIDNIRDNFSKSVDLYNKIPDSLPIKLCFKPLEAGYGEHLFNEIARDIISADIAVFETSNLNPNVMLEMGVALTWGVRVLPIKQKDCPKPPSDISGQTWADYEDNGARFLDSEHSEKLLRMVERAARKKIKK